MSEFFHACFLYSPTNHYHSVRDCQDGARAVSLLMRWSVSGLTWFGLRSISPNWRRLKYDHLRPRATVWRSFLIGFLELVLLETHSLQPTFEPCSKASWRSSLRADSPGELWCYSFRKDIDAIFSYRWLSRGIPSRFGHSFSVSLASIVCDVKHTGRLSCKGTFPEVEASKHFACVCKVSRCLWPLRISFTRSVSDTKPVMNWSLVSSGTTSFADLSVPRGNRSSLSFWIGQWMSVFRLKFR